MKLIVSKCERKAKDASNAIRSLVLAPAMVQTVAKEARNGSVQYRTVSFRASSPGATLRAENKLHAQSRDYAAEDLKSTATAVRVARSESLRRSRRRRVGPQVVPSRMAGLHSSLARPPRGAFRFTCSVS